MSTSRQSKKADSGRSTLRIVIGVIIALAVAALLIWNSGILTRNADAVTIGDETFSVADVNYYYYSVRSSTAEEANIYAQYGMSHGYDYNVADALQMYDAEKTYAEYFMEQALIQLQTITLLCREAEAAGFTLSEEQQADYEASLRSMEANITYASLMRGSSEASYIQALYGPHASMKLLKENLKAQTLASAYSTMQVESYTYDDAAIEGYYEENASDLDTFAYRAVFVSAEPEVSIDEETGEELEATEEQIEAAMADARIKADALAGRVRSGEDFNTAAMDYVDEDTRTSLADPDYGYTSDMLGSSVTTLIMDWADEDGRENGDVGVLEQEGSGYQVVLLLDRQRDDEARQHADVWSILVTAETTDTTDEEGNVTSAPTEEQLAAALAEAEALQAAWLSSSADRSEEAFRALVPETEEPEASEEDESAEEPAEGDEVDVPDAATPPQVQILSEVNRGSYGTDFDAFVFLSGQELNASEVIPVTDSTGEITGYRFAYIADFGPIRWMGIAEDAMRDADYETWFSALQEQYPITRLAGLEKAGL